MIKEYVIAIVSKKLIWGNMWSVVDSWKLKSFSEKLGSYDSVLPLLRQRCEKTF
jgi:hypothetical protein